jgi:hypothetical protein
MLVAVLVAGSSHTAAAQGFAPGYTDIGPVLGLGSIGDANLAFGGRFEAAIKTLPSMGDGVLGIQAGFQYYSWSNGDFSVSYIPIGVTANYHFNMVDTKFDPFVGLGLGFQIASCDSPGIPGGCSGHSSEIYFVGRAGARYFVSDKVALYADIGAGGATLNLGAMFRLK